MTTDEQLSNSQSSVAASNAMMEQVRRRAGSSLDAGELAAFRGAPPEQHREFMLAFEQAMNMPVVRTPVGQMTPNAYLGRMGVPEQSIENAKRSLAGLPFDETDTIAMDARDALLDQMKETLPGGPSEYAYDTGATPKQVAEFDKKGPMESRWQLTPEGEQGYQAERVYNLFSTFQNGLHAPVWSDVGSKVLGGAGALLATVYNDKLTQAHGLPQGAVGKDMRRLAMARLNTPAGRMDESLYWWNRGTPDGTVGDSVSGMKYPSLSSTTLQGMTTKLDTTDNAIPYYNQQRAERYLYNLDLPTADRSMLQQMRDDLLRTTPRYPENADPKEMRKLIADLRDFDSANRGFANAEYPEFVRRYGTVPSAWAAGTDWYGNTDASSTAKIAADRSKMATYLSPFGEMMANYPRDAIDATTLGGLGVGSAIRGTKLLDSLTDASRYGAKAMAKTTAREAGDAAAGAAKGVVGEIREETPQNYAMQSVNNPNAGFFSPMRESIVKDFAGETVDPNNPAYAMYLNDAYERRKKVLGSLLDRGTTMYGLPSVQ